MGHPDNATSDKCFICGGGPSSAAPFPGPPSSSPGPLHQHASISPDQLHPPAAPSLTITTFDSADAEMTINKTLSPAAFTTVVTGEASHNCWPFSYSV